jgi:hypothetical protein
MSAAQISDLELDQLLGQAPAPPAPPADLANRIAARALRTPQEPAGRFSFAARSRPRARATLWTAVVAANLMAAAAAATAWDGQRFDFHRLTDLPKRVAAAIHIEHNPSAKALVAQRKAVTMAHVAPRIRAAGTKAEASRAEPASAVATRVVMQPMQVRPQGATRAIERPHVIERENAGAHVRFQPYQRRVVVPPHRIARVRPNQPREESASAMPERSQLGAPGASLRQERLEQRPATAERQQVAPEVAVPALPPEHVGEQRQATADGEAWRNDEYRRRLARWRNQLHERERPRERGGHFRHRF